MMKTEKAQAERLQDLGRRLRITKVVASRTVKGRFGDTFVGYAAEFDSVQEEGGRGLLHAGDGAAASQGVTLEEARIAGLLLGMQADISAHDHAFAGSNIQGEEHAAAIQGIKHNYSLLISELLGGSPDLEKDTK